MQVISVLPVLTVLKEGSLTEKMTAPGRTLVARVAHQLAEISLDAEDGSYIGAEDELLERLGVSRPTLRQAAKIAETERMISVRRGVRGGFYARRPDVSDAIATINRYLRLQGAGLRDLRVLHSAQAAAARMASASSDETLRAGLGEMLVEMDHCDDAISMMRFDIRLAEHIAVMSGNPVVQLVTGMSYAFGRDEQGIYLYGDAGQRTEVRRHYRALVDAILAGDGHLAEFHMERRLALIHGWIDAADEADLRPINEV